MSRLKTLLTWMFHPSRTSEFVVVFIFSFWTMAMIVRPSESFVSDVFITVAANPFVLTALCGMLLLVWLNFFRRIDVIREWVQVLPVIMGVYVCNLVYLSVPHHPSPSMGFYLGATLLAIFVCINNNRRNGQK